MKYTFSIALMLLLLVVNSAQAQFLVRGRVIDKDTKEPLCNATVACDCCHKGVPCTTCKEVAITDASGSFSIRVTAGDRLRISCVSYQDREILPDNTTGQVVAGKDAAGQVVELDPRNDRMQEVVISANRTVQRRTEAPVAISMINAKTIADTKATQLDQLLNKVSGVFMVDLGNEQHEMSIRQPMSTGNVFLYLEDGLPIRTSGIFNHNALLEMNQVAAHQIEIIRGPASALYGAEAIGGAINVVTQAPPSVPAGRVSVQANNNGYRRIEAQAGATLKKWGLIASGYYANRTDGPIQYSDFHKTAVTLRADYHANNRLNWINSLTYVNYYSQMYGALDSIHFADRDYHTPYPFTYRKVDALRIRTQLIYRWSSSAETQVLLSYRDNSIGQNPSYYISNSRTNLLLASGQVNVSSFHSYMLTAQHRQSIDRWNSQLIAGMSTDISPSGYQAQYIAIRRDGKGNYLDYSNTDSALSHYSTGINNFASYLNIEVKPFPGWKVTAAARYDYFHYRFRNFLPPSASTGAPDSRNDYCRLTPKAGVTYNHGGLGFYVNYSQGYVPPQVSNLYNGVKVPYLQPQTFFNYEAGGWWSLWKGKLYADVSLYRLDGTNQIISIRQDDGTYQNANAGRTRHTGVEYGVTAKPSSEWAFRVSASHSDHIFLVQYENNHNYSGNQMAAAPHFLSNMEVTWKPAALKGFRAAVEWQHMGRYWMDDANTVRYRGFDVFNARIGYAFRRWEWWVSGLNILNRYYSTLATRSAYGYSYNLGTPREITLGMSWQLFKRTALP